MQWAESTRLEEISVHVNNTNVFVAIGTGRIAYAVNVTQSQLSNRTCLQMGWGSSRVPNYSCGLEVSFGKKLYGALQRTITSPPYIMGRVGLVQLNHGSTRKATFPVHIPPKGLPAGTLRSFTRNICKTIEGEVGNM